VAEAVVYDAWTPISFKRALGSRSATAAATAGAGFNPPPWVPELDKRRVIAYAILRAYQDNAAREFMTAADREEIDNRREYGDAALLMNTVLGALLGEDQVVVTEGSELADDQDATSTEKADGQRAKELEDWLRQWAKDERLQLKVIEAERRAVGLGDGVYSLGWSDEKGRPRLRVWDPTFYFPVLEDGNEDDFPRKVHIAWEIADDEHELPAGKVRIRRITWQLGPIVPANQPGLLAGLFRDPELHPGDFVDEGTGRIMRQYAWNDEPSPWTCYMTDATWTVDRADRSVKDLTGGEAVYEVTGDGRQVNMLDLGIDFLPVVHLPNTVALLEHFGRSILSSVLQILDDLASADTDLSAAAATTGHPVIALEGGTVQRDSQGRANVTYKPGEILEGDGKISVLDTSRSLEALTGYIEFLLKRLSVNSRVSEGLLGRVKPSEVPSGVALALSFGPTEQLIKEMRLVRSEKYPLLLKFAHRLALAGGMEGAPAEWVESDLQMGSFLPQDQSAAVEMVTKLLAVKPRPAISLETAVTMLVEAGLPIRDAFAEVERIQSRDFEGAAELLGLIPGTDRSLVAEYLGRDIPDAPEPQPAVQDPGAVDENGDPVQPPVQPPAGQPAGGAPQNPPAQQ
jgi:hypothetical protein